MGRCESCGEKSKHEHTDFTRSIIEIDNPESLVLLRKVTIPASMGTEEDVPASVGKYRNVVLLYEANKHVYIYSSDGIPTFIETELSQDILDRIADLEQEDTIIWRELNETIDDLDEEISTRARDDLIIQGTVNTLGNRVTTAEGDIDVIEGKIPSQATAQNQLADKDFVNSSIATNTANFIGTFNSVAELEAYTGPVTNNDYAFVIVTDSQGNTAYDRYKYSSNSDEWLFEYELNNSSFTAAQWAAINSNITASGTTKLNGLANIKTIGSNLSLSPEGELSAPGASYTAGDDIDITNNVISFDGGNDTVSQSVQSTSFSINALQGQPINLNLYGDTEQTTYSGKNLITLDALNNLLPTATSKTQSGITFTVNSDGSITVSGTSNDIVTLEWTGISLLTGYYELSGCPANGSDSTYRMDAIYTSGGSGWIGYDYGNGLTFTTTQTSTITVRIRIASGVTMNNVVFKPVLKSWYLSSANGSQLVINGTTPQPQNIFIPQSLNFTLPAGTYTWSIKVLSGSTSGNGSFAIYLRSEASGSSGEIAHISNNNVETPVTFTLNSTKTIHFQIYCNAGGRIFNNYTLGMQVESGSAATTYEPYVGGTASPNPDYPQEIKTVTGVQTVAVNNTNYTVDLGDIELCKIRDYQDYIYRSGNNWYLHKETNRYVFTGLEDMSMQNNTRIYINALQNGIDSPYNNSSATSTGGIYCSNLVEVTPAQTWGGTAQGISYDSASTDNNRGFDIYISGITTLADYRAAIAGYEIVYKLKDFTDTKITNTALLQQLGSISLATGANTITVSSDNLPAALTMTAYVDTPNGKWGAGLNKQDKLVAGDNITIEGNVISSTGGDQNTIPVVTLASGNTTWNCDLTFSELYDSVNAGGNIVISYSLANNWVKTIGFLSTDTGNRERLDVIILYPSGTSPYNEYSPVIVRLLPNNNVTWIGSDMRSATTSRTGVVRLSNSVSSTSDSLAATSSAVKQAYDLANTAVGANSYSTSEVDTGATWIDGKTIYKKTIYVGALGNNANKSVAHGITDMDELVDAKMTWYDTTDQKWYSNPRIDSSSIFIDFSGVSSTQILVKSAGTDWSSRTNNCRVTLYYTRMTVSAS